MSEVRLAFVRLKRAVLHGEPFKRRDVIEAVNRMIELDAVQPANLEALALLSQKINELKRENTMLKKLVKP